MSKEKKTFNACDLELWPFNQQIAKTSPVVHL